MRAKVIHKRNQLSLCSREFWEWYLPVVSLKGTVSKNCKELEESTLHHLLPGKKPGEEGIAFVSLATLMRVSNY